MARDLDDIFPITDETPPARERPRDDAAAAEARDEPAALDGPHQRAPSRRRPPRRRPVSRLDINPLVDPLAASSGRRDRTADGQAGAATAERRAEFTAADVVAIREKLHATQRQFAQMFGISVETLRNWEQGKRRPQGPARALLRVARANPEALARTLWRYRRVWWMN